MEILISIMGKIAEYTIAPIKKQVGYLIFYKDNFEELHIQVQELEGVRDQIKHCIEAERRNGREIEGAVLNWLGKVDEIIEPVKQLVKDPHHRNVGCSNWSFLDLWSQHQLSRNAKKMAKKIIKVRQGKEKFNQVAYMPPLDEIGSTFATKGSEKLESRKLMKEDIMLALRDPKISKIGVYGLSGVGKTTLVKEVEKQVKDDKLFDAVVIANVSNTPDLERIQCEIADHLGLHFEEMTIIGRARRLCERIKKEKSILIILDDIWKRLDLEKLEIPSEDDHKGCKLLLTSRNQDILRIMGSEKDFRLDVLNEEETWSLFEDMAVDVVKDASLQSIATQVAKKCAGLPVLIVTVARALRNKDINHWKDALNQLPRVDNKGINEIVYSALEFSYNNLDSDEVKALFLLCGVLYSNIPFEYLLKCVIGLGIFKHINTLKDARFRLHKLIDSLKASCLLLESNTHTKVEMHNTISEVALSIASRDQHVIKIGWDVKLNEWPTDDLLQRCPHMIILEECHIHKLPERLECSNVKFFYLNNSNSSLGISDSFFEGMRYLIVLDLTCMHLPSLPKSFCSLIDLQTLCLDQCALGDMTNIGALKNLQILSLYESSMIRLPSELGQLTLLRMLDLTNSRIEIIPSNIISKLTKLEELYMGNTSIKWELENSIEENRNATLAELKHLTNLTALEFQIQEAWILPRDLMFERLERYKIVIGEVWEWSDNYGASKMLKLKLGTNIHLEHGIKELIKEVEDLYLDKINGISNVLYHLNGEGFPMLKHLYIQNNVEIQHIINSMERNQTHVLFPNLETLILQNLNNLEKICHGPLIVNSFGKLRVIKVKSCNQLEHLFSILMVEAFSQLLEIEVSECSSIKKIVLVESANSGRTIDDKIEFYSLRSLTLRHLPIIDDFCSNELMSSLTTKQNSLRTNVPTSFFNAKVKFSNLETLKLSSINLEKVWDDDRLSPACSIHNLAKLIVEDCRGLKYLFSSSMIESFLNLKQLEISKCDMMEEIIATKGRNGTALEEVRLSKLETIAINNMKSLKKVWHFQFDGLKTLEVNDCGKLQNIFPSYLQRTFGSLETLKVSDCSSMEEIFELAANEIQSEEDTTTELKKLHLLRLPKLKRIWSNDPQGILRFHNLQDMHVEYCENIEYLFPFSIAMDLLQLEKLHMNSCGMEQIVAKKEGLIGEKAIFHFHRLHSLAISNMHKLDGFYAGNHILACPWLRVLRGFKCAKLELFERQCRSNQGKNSDSKTHVSRQQPFFIVEEVIPSLEELNLSYKDTIMILQDQQQRDHFRKLKILRLYDLEDKQAATFLDSILQKAPNLETLVVQDSSLKEIFQDERRACKEGKNEISTQLKMLTLSNLQLQHICREGCQIDSILEVLEVLYVTECASLKNLVPSSVTFSHLTYLEIKYCNGLINLISLSTARSLVKLQSMTLKECNSLEEIVTQEVIGAKDEIVFSSLKILELECLPRLNSFSCSKCFFKFPMLKKVVVRQCPKMKIFSASETRTPMLRKVLKEENDEEWCWEGDLNGTIRKMFLDKVAFRNSKHLDLSMYPELKGLWYNQVENKIFCNLKSLVVQKCDFLSNVLISSNFLRTLCNLEELVVGDCDSLEVVLEFNSKHEGGMLEKEAIHLRKISLSNLPSVKHIWTQDYQEIVSFGDLGDVHKVSKTPGFGEKREEDEPENQGQQPLFSVAKVLLPNLETIIINDMQNLKTIWHPILTPTSMGSFKTLEVNKCEKLENLFPSYMHGAFASLETLTVSDCNSVQVIFQLGVNDMRSAEDTTQLKNITLLRLPQLKQIWSRDPQTILRFHNLQVVRVEDCEDLEYLFPFFIAMDLLQLEEITIKHAVKMKEIVSKNEEPVDSPVKFEFNHITSLVLWYLYELKGFFAGNHSLSCPSLRQLDVRHCAKWKLFKTQGTSSQGRVSDSKLQVSTQRSLFTLEEVMCNLEKLALNSEDANMILQGQFSGEQFCKLKFLCLIKFEDDQATFPYWFLQNIASLEWLVVEWSSFKEIFQDEGPIDENAQFEIRTRIKLLMLNQLHELQHICKEGFQMDPVLEVLEYLEVNQCSNLKHLVPSSVAFSHLTYLEVQNCNGLIDLITSSTARSLVKLTTMKIRECNSLEQVVPEEGEETMDEIAFSSLEVLVLECLPRLKMFCPSKCLLKLPLLEKFVVRQCPRMRSFCVRDTSAPMLRKILTDEQDEKWYWEGDLNRTINKMFVDMVAFRSFKYLEISQYPELKELWYSHVQPEMFGNLKHLVVQKCDFLSNVLLPSNLLLVLSNLEELEVRECGSLEAVFDLTTMNEKEMLTKETIHLKRITLSSLPKFKHIWKQNSRENDSFDNLGEIYSVKCQGLRILEIQGFRETPEEEDEGDIQHQQPASLVEQVLFPNLETIIINDMPELKTIWHPVLTPNSISSLKTMEVSDCEKLENIFPSYMERAFGSLETLTVSDCNSVQEIFELSSEMSSAEDTTRLQKLTLLRLSKLKQIWSRDPQTSLRFHDLQVVRVEHCERLEYLFPFSIAMHMPQLEQITIKDAGRMKEIVSDKEGPVDSTIKFEFNRITSLVLWNLNEFRGFFAGNHSLACPALRGLDVFNCEKLKLFKTQYSVSQGRVPESKLRVSKQQPLFTLEEVICNLEELRLNDENASMILQGQFSGDQFCRLKFLYLSKFENDQTIFPYWFLQDIISLECLLIEWSSFKEIFQEERPIDDKGQIEVRTRIKKLTLYQLHELQHICKEGFQLDPVLEVLEYLDVIQCSNLKHLVPSSVTFSHLTYLEVQNCNGLVDLITSSTARSLVELTTLKIRVCNSVEQIVAEEGEESRDEIAFSSLEILELECLPRLTMFCSSNCFLKFPLLEKVVVRNCPIMKIFSLRDTSTPTLRKVLTKKEDEKWFWEGDLNRTVNKIFQDMAIREGDEGNYEESSSNFSESSQLHQKTSRTRRASSSEEQEEQAKPDQIVDAGRQEIYKLLSLSDEREQKEHASSTDPPRIHEVQERQLVEAAQNVPSPTTTQDAAIGTQEMYETTERPLVQLAQNTLSFTTIQDTGTQEMYETIEGPLDLPAQNTLNLTTIQDAESLDSRIRRSKNLFNETTASITADNIETIGTQKISETIDRPVVQAAQNALSSTTIQDTESHGSKICPRENFFNQNTTSITGNKKETIQNQEMYETIEKPLVLATQNTLSLGTIQDTEESHDSDIHPSENLFNNQTMTSMTANYKETTGTQAMCETIKRPLVQATQNALSPPMVHDAGSNGSAIDPAPSQAPLALDACSSYKGMIDIPIQNLPYLEAGVKRHPQVLDWLHTKRRRVFASSFFSLFAEVTHLLRTTRRGDLTKDDQNYIIDCCASLEVVGFDAPWLNYVYRCIEECGDGENLKRRLKEAEGQASTLKAQLESIKKELASVEASLVLLRDKANRLDDFIES